MTRPDGSWVVVLLALCTVVLCHSGCSTTHTLQATILDTNGQPIPGSILYAEAYTHRAGTFDFAFAAAGDSGEVPMAGREPLRIRWRPGARLALAALAPGKKPVVIYDPLGRVKGDGITFILEDLPQKGRRWEPRIAKLAYPFEDHPELAARAATPACEDLRNAFRNAYHPLATGEEPALSRESQKLKALERLEWIARNRTQGL